MSKTAGAVALILFVALGAALPATGQEEKGVSRKEVRVAGIMFDLDQEHHWMTVKADGEDAPVKYLIDPSNERLARSLQTVFNASRVQLTYRGEEDGRRLLSVRRQVGQPSGTVTGVVIGVHNNFWVEVKPRRGPADAFAPGADNYNDEAFMASLRSLRPGDSVTIRYTSDLERHRIVALRKNPPAPAPAPRKAASPASSG
jgi:hypothetical protein